MTRLFSILLLQVFLLVLLLVFVYICLLDPRRILILIQSLLVLFQIIDPEVVVATGMVIAIVVIKAS